MERALCRRAVTEEGDGDAVPSADLRRRGRTDGDGQPGRHDPVGAEDPEGRVGDVHRAAATSVGAIGPAHELGEHPERIQTFGQAVPVSAMGGRDDVVGSQRPAGADRRRFLSDGEVHEAGNEAVAVEVGDALLEAPNAQHALLHFQQVGARRDRRKLRWRSSPTCTVLTGTRGSLMSGRIEITESSLIADEMVDYQRV